MSSPFRRIAPLLFAVATLSLASERIDLDGQWQFRIDPDKTGAKHGWTQAMPVALDTVNVPHTWNIGRYEDFEGTAWYFRNFSLPAGTEGKHVELHFGGTFYQARVWVNGTEAGSHEGGHTAWFVDITPYLKARNLISVEINNEPGFATIPGYAMDLKDGGNLWYDWWHYGGIVRDVWVTMSGPVLLRNQHIRSKVNPASDQVSAEVSDEVFIENFSKRTEKLKLKVTLISPDNDQTVALGTQDVSAAPGKSSVKVSKTVDSLRLWHFDHPEVYRVEASLLDASGTPIDTIGDNYGFRTLELRDRHLYLNGERVRLTGMTRHEESPFEGLAETRGTMLHDYSEMKDLQVTLTRPVHYPQHPFILDFCDRNGILLVPEIPIWHFSEQQFTDPKVIALARQMMTEMIEQNWNHPAIFGWSVCNESSTNTPGGREYFKTLYETVKALDPDRYVSYADDRIALADPKVNAASLADFVMMNEYFGTWHGDPANLAPVLERVGREYPDKMIIVSEFGAAGTFAKNKVDGDALRRKIITEHLATFRKYDFIGGAILWCYQDYRSHRNLRPGEKSGLVEMGVVDENRQRYPSYALWKEENSPAEARVRFLFDGFVPAGFSATVSRRGEDTLPSYPLHGYRAVWEVRDNARNLVASGARAFGDMGSPRHIEIAFKAPGATELHLTFKLVRPTGYTALEKTVEWSSGPSGGDTVQDMQKRGVAIP
ncbi:MAG: glycoside hydrolase family 2 TIM barrel-domain containing protein [Bryobacteraceae bacterium]|nr:glycoside hydrolase family 2 TIM barrel-domain containing protein [Bryobacteraceae bacterium]